MRANDTLALISGRDTTLEGATHRDDGWSNFFPRCQENFSVRGFVFSSAVGAMGGTYTWQMLRWAGAPTALLPSLKTAEGIVIRGNSAAKGVAVNQAGQAIIGRWERDAQDNSAGESNEDGP